MTDFANPNLSLPVPMVVGFLFSVVFLPPYIKYLKARQLGQFVREEGPKEHAAKAKTPTTGGVVFLAACVVATCTSVFLTKILSLPVFVVLVAAVICGAIGFADDAAKFVHKANRGISGKTRLLLEALLGVGVALILVRCGAQPSFGPWILPMGLYVAFAGFFMAAVTNAVNLHDGMDGLAAGTSAQVLATLAFMLYSQDNLELAAVALAGCGAVAGFLLYNKNPAKIFMGDTGSLFLGGLMAALALAGNLVIWFIPLSLIYIVETVSVMAQVVYFKLTKPYAPSPPISGPKLIWTKLTKHIPGEGKRLLRMAPLHHHFESVGRDKGLKEWQVVALFHLVQFTLCVVTILIFINVGGLAVNPG